MVAAIIALREEYRDDSKVNEIQNTNFINYSIFYALYELSILSKKKKFEETFKCSWLLDQIVVVLD